MATPQSWDIFCKVIDNFGDIGVCWRLACGLAASGQQVRLWVDDASALAFMAPHGASGVQARAWTAHTPSLGLDEPGDVVVEAFGCDVDPAWIAAGTSPAPIWINLEYLTAEAFAQRSHGLPSPVMAGPAVGMTKWFYYPGFTGNTGGLLRERDLLAQQALCQPADWLAQQGVPFDASVQNISLFCYEPAALQAWLAQLENGPQRMRLLVTHGRATAAVAACLTDALPTKFVSKKALQTNEILRNQLLLSEQLTIHYLPALTQQAYDHLLWSCQFNCVRGEDSLVRALWAGKPFVWHIYPQHDGAHAAKLDAFLDWLQAPTDLRLFHHVWNGLSDQSLPAIDFAAWGAVAQAARQRLLVQTDLATQLMTFAQAKSDQR
jgi:uncharacterized repeat protein (TIGR03837 family)